MTRSLPANAMARAKVPMSTMILNTLKRSQWSDCMSSVPKMKMASISNPVLAMIQSFTSGLMNGDFDTPFINIKYESTANATPPNTPTVYRSCFL